MFSFTPLLHVCHLLVVLLSLRKIVLEVSIIYKVLWEFGNVKLALPCA